MRRTRLQWGAVWAGWIIGAAFFIMLALLGVTLEGWSFDAREVPMTRMPLSIAIWIGLALTATACISGYMAAHLAAAQSRREGLYHGLAVWGVNWVVMTGLVISALLFTIESLVTTAGEALTSLSERVATTSPFDTKALDQSRTGQNELRQDLRKQIESVLRATGKDELQPERIKQDVGAIRDQARIGQSAGQMTESILTELQQKIAALDRDAAINVMTIKLEMTRSQAEQVVRSLLPVVRPLKRSMLHVKDASLDLTNAAANRIGHAAWWLFLLSLVTLIAALIGGLLGFVKAPSAAIIRDSIQDVRRTGSLRP